MFTAIHTVHAIDTIAAGARFITTTGAAAGEVLTAGALLWTLNGTATAIRTTYRAGAATRRLVDATLIPTADAISWVAAQIDWVETARTVWGCVLTVGVAFYVAGEATGRAFRAWHADWVGTVDWAPAEPPAAPAPAPVEIAEPVRDLASFKVVELRRMAKGKAKGLHLMRKAELIALLSA